jgi:hypothetical protein
MLQTHRPRPQGQGPAGFAATLAEGAPRKHQHAAVTTRRSARRGRATRATGRSRPIGGCDVRRGSSDGCGRARTGTPRRNYFTRPLRDRWPCVPGRQLRGRTRPRDDRARSRNPVNTLRPNPGEYAAAVRWRPSVSGRQRRSSTASTPSVNPGFTRSAVPGTAGATGGAAGACRPAGRTRRGARASGRACWAASGGAAARPRCLLG